MSELQEVQHDERKHHYDFRIIVNGREKEVPTCDVSFDEVVRLSGLPTGPDVVFTVTYKHAEGPRSHGTLTEGEVVKVKNGTIFNVTRTNKS